MKHFASPRHTTSRSIRAARTISRRTRQRGVSSLMLLVLLIPLLLAVGIAVDVARMVQFRSDLQSAVDGAALAGAAAFIDSTQTVLATTVATNYFNRAILPRSLSVSSPTVVPNPAGTINPVLGSAAAHSVQVSATAKVQTTLLGLVLSPTYTTISATATAANPVVQASLVFPTQISAACDGNSIYLYQVPQNATKTGYDYSSVPAYTASNYYRVYTSYPSSSSLGQSISQTLPTFSVNQPLGVMLRNDTNGNVGNSNCGVKVTGANSYGAPSGSSQAFYSSLLMNGQSPSENSNYTYTATVTYQTSYFSSGRSINSYTLTLPPSTLYPTGRVITGTGSNLASTSDQFLELFGPNPPGSSGSGCSTVSSVSSSGWTGTTTTATFSCKTQYRTSKSGTGNCSLYIQTGSGVTASYLSGLTPNSAAPSAAQGTCFNMTGGGAANSAPSCAQLSALASGTGSSAVAPAAVFWWDDAGGVGPGEQYFSPSSHCSQISSSSPGYGEDCQYKNMVVALQCSATGGSGTGYTAVVLTQ